MKIKDINWLLVGWIMIVVLGNVVWLLLDKYPPAWDQAAHIRSVVLANHWLKGEFWGNFFDLVKAFGGYPPLIYLLGGVWSLIFGTGVAGISLLNTVFLIMAMIGVYKLAGNKLLPVIIFSLFPVVYDVSRNMLLDLALTAWVVWGLYFWLKKNDIGILVMLTSASLTKLNGFIYFFPIIAIYFWEALKSEKKFLRLVAGGLIYLIVVGWWWGINVQNIYQYLTGLAGQGEKLTDPMNLGDWQTWIHYFKLFFLQQVGPITAIVFLIFGKKENKKLIWWTVVTYVIFTIIKNKDFRFTLPLLPVVAVWMGQIKQRWIIGLLLLWMGFNYVENSFNWPIKKPVIVTTPTFLLGDINWIDFEDYPVREVRQQIWPNEKILEDIPNAKTKLLIIMNIAEMNDNTLGMYRVMMGKENLEIHGVDKWEKMKFDYILVPDLKTESAPFYDTQLESRKAVIKNIWENIGKYQIIKEYNLPNGGKVGLLKV